MRGQLEISDIAAYQQDVLSSLQLFCSNVSPYYAQRFFGLTSAEISSILVNRLEEADLSGSLTILAALEALFQVDYESRVDHKMKDVLSRAFRDIAKQKGDRVSFDQDILETWKSHTTGLGGLIGDFRSALRYRHWLAHGRYWEPKLGRRYDFQTLWSLASDILESFPLER